MKTNFICLFCFLSLFASAKKKRITPNLSGTYVLAKQLSSGQLLPVHHIKSKISIDQTNKRIACNVGCNSISGNFNADKNKIDPLQLISTEMSCGDFLDQLETTFVQNLSKINRYRTAAMILYLLEGEKILIVLRRK